MEPIAISHFCAYLRTRNSSPHTIENYGRDLRLFFALRDQDPCTVSWREVDAFIQQQHTAQRAATTINRRLHAVKHFFASLVMERQTLASHPVQPSHFLRRGAARCRSSCPKTRSAPCVPTARPRWITPCVC